MGCFGIRDIKKDDGESQELAPHPAPIVPGSESNMNTESQQTQRPGDDDLIPRAGHGALNPEDNLRAAPEGPRATGDDDFNFLAEFDTCFVVDDSFSMRSHWDEVRTLVRTIMPLCADRDTTGVDIYFGNHKPSGSFMGGIERAGYRHIGLVQGSPEMHDNVEGIFNLVRPGLSASSVSKRLIQILDNYMLQYEKSIQQPEVEKTDKDELKPLNIIVVTAHSVGSSLSKHVLEIAGKLDKLNAPAHQIGLQFFQIGSDAKVADHMKKLDDVLHHNQQVRDIVDTTTWTDGPGKLSPEGMLKALGGAVTKSFDNMHAEKIKSTKPLPQNASD
jgi:hypothetical protein